MIPFDALINPNIFSNPVDRCYFCKTDLFTHLTHIADKLNIRTLVDGSNLDDMKDFRPGVKALRNLGIRGPLKEVGLTKQEIRDLSKKHGLPTWDKASFSCLATRIPYHQELAPEKLRQIEQAEQLLFDLGYQQFRVRHHGEIARIEVLPEDFTRVLGDHQKIVEQLKSFGFQYVTLDLEGYFTGSMNRQIKKS
ncbi:ATP-dependent sacrificial sulfur transferase LarE [Tepidibacillus marianensis]|uniref:ATP-dependent sacrificial sulfur transferase LarE n=1 Tax=Tepidibacillus marianensis TaxID=3131995 RepID=UPI0030D549F9